jgi:hypothetical protein
MGTRKWFTENATPVMVKAGFTPIEPYPGNTNSKWQSKCIKCGEITSPVFGNILQRADKKKTAFKGCHDCWLTREKTDFPKCLVPICVNKVQTLPDDYCNGHKLRFEKYGEVFPDFPLKASLHKNRKCKVPTDDKGTPCGNEIFSYCGLDYNKWTKFNPESIKWGRVCVSHRQRWYEKEDFEEGVALRRVAPKHQTLEDLVKYYLDFSNGYIKKNRKGCFVWQGQLSHTKNGKNVGYAFVGDIENRGKKRFLSRMVWEVLKNEKIIEGNQIHHICGTTECVNIEHLECISYKENQAEACRVKALRAEIVKLKKEIRRLKRGNPRKST